MPSRAGREGGGLETPPTSRPGTQESEQRLLCLNGEEEEEGSRGKGTRGGGRRRSSDLLRINPHASNFKVARTFDDALDTYRETVVKKKYIYISSYTI